MSNTRKLAKSTAYSDSTSIVPSVLIEGFESTTGITGSTDVSNIASSVQHIGVGTKSVQFDKSGTTQAFATVEKTITSVDLTAYTAHYSIEFEIYLSTLVNVSTVQVSIGTDSSNYISWSTDGEFLVAGWNAVTKGLNYPETQVGNGVDYSAITWIAITIIFDAVGNTLTGIRVDNIELHSTETHALEEMVEKSGDAWLDHAISVIQSTYGDAVSVGVKNKDLIKFGRSEQVDLTTKTTLMTLPATVFNETYPTTNLITHISSSSAADTEELYIEYHTVDGSGNFTFGTQTKTLTGQTRVALDVPAARVSRLRNNSTGTPPANGTDLVGNIYCFEDVAVTAGGVPVTLTAVHCMIRAGEQNSEKAATTTSSTDYWIITSMYADVLEKKAASGEVNLEIREKSGVFIEVFGVGVSNIAGAFRDPAPYLIVPPNSDIRLRGLADAAATTMSGGIVGVLAKKI